MKAVPNTGSHEREPESVQKTSLERTESENHPKLSDEKKGHITTEQSSLPIARLAILREYQRNLILQMEEVQQEADGFLGKANLEKELENTEREINNIQKRLGKSLDKQLDIIIKKQYPSTIENSHSDKKQDEFLANAELEKVFETTKKIITSVQEKLKKNMESSPNRIPEKDEKRLSMALEVHSLTVEQSQADIKQDNRSNKILKQIEYIAIYRALIKQAQKFLSEKILRIDTILSDYEKIKLNYLELVATLSTHYNDEISSNFFHELRTIFLDYFIFLTATLQLQPYSLIFDIEINAPFSEQAVMKKWLKLNSLFNLEEMEFVSVDFLNYLITSRNELLQRKNCEKYKSSLKKDLENKYSASNFFPRKESLEMNDLDGLGLPELDLTDEKIYSKMLKLVGGRFGVGEYILRKGIDSVLKSDQLRKIKEELKSDSKRPNFLKMEQDYKQISQALVMFVPFEQKHVPRDYRSMGRLLLQRLFDTLNYLIEMATIKYPAWLRNNNQEIQKLIIKLNDNINAEKMADHFLVIKNLIKFGEDYFKRNQDAINDSNEEKYLSRDVELYIGYIALFSENSDLFPDILSDEAVITKTKDVIFRLDSVYNKISTDNDLILETFSGYKNSVKREHLRKSCNELILSKMRQNDIEYLDKRLESKLLTPEMRTKLSDNKQGLLNKQRDYEKTQITLKEHYGEEFYLNADEQKNIASDGLLLEVKLNELQKRFHDLKLPSSTVDSDEKKEFRNQGIISKGEVIDELLKNIINELIDNLAGKIFTRDMVDNLSKLLNELNACLLQLETIAQKIHEQDKHKPGGLNIFSKPSAQQELMKAFAKNLDNMINILEIMLHFENSRSLIK